MLKNLYVHTPAQLLAVRMPFLLNRNLQPEVACQEVSIDKLDLGQMNDCALRLAEQGLGSTVHAPFIGFAPGSPKKRDLKNAHRICQQSLQLATALNAGCIVFHPGVPYRAGVKAERSWLENSLAFWPDYIEQAAAQGIRISVENIYESSTDLFEPLFTALGCTAFGHCFDIGHWNIFAEQPLSSWFERLGRHINHIHLHDNLGSSDQHLPIGYGDIDFPALFAQLKALPEPPSMTLEAHRLPELETSLNNLQPYLA